METKSGWKFLGPWLRTEIATIPGSLWSFSIVLHTHLFHAQALLSNDPDFMADPDPFDEISKDTLQIGIILRTDFTDEDAWQSFYSKLKDAEQTFVAENNPEPEDEHDPSSSD